MKTNYTPRYIKRENLYNALFYFVAKLHRVKILIIPALLFAQVSNAQQLLAMNDGHPGASGPYSKITKTDTKPEPASNDSVSSAPIIKKTAPMFIPNNEDRARAMVTDYFRGVDDADDNYKAKKSGKTAIMASTLLGGPIAGIIPTIVCSATVPNNKNLNVPHSANITNDAYMKGYRNEAHYIKRHNTWPRFILASVAWLAAINILIH